MNSEKFRQIFGYEPQFMVKAPGRTELGGNHTDHQNGKVLAAPVDIFIYAAAGLNSTDKINIYSEGYEAFSVDINDTDIHPEEYGTTKALVRGVMSEFAGKELPGFDAYITSEIPSGSGLSSSAAFEILIGRICCSITGTRKTPTELAIIGKKAENIYFGKPSGLMDQMACAADSVIAIDFEDTSAPRVTEVNISFSETGYSLCIINCGSGHENMTSCYSDITTELKNVCSIFGADVLRQVDENEFYAKINDIRSSCGDRAVLRAMHVFEENRRVDREIDALKNKDIESFLDIVKESGRSSRELLQNIIPAGESLHQDMAFALAYAEKCLKGKGAVRVHGGGFAGTIQAYVPSDMTDSFRESMEAILGTGSCTTVHPGDIN
ncbi:MAG: galactokinase [Parasporobacterium sp.]|nr:galactokinase [Parasporobacterium sp.]